MEPLTKNGSDEFNRQDPNAILNACREIDRGIQEIENSLYMLQQAQTTFLNDASGNKQAFQQLEESNASTMSLYRNLVGKLKNIKQKPESGSTRNAPQVGKVDRQLKTTINKYQQVDRDFRKKLEDQAARQYRIVRPDATEEEVREAVEDPSQQMFAQALMQSNRQGQSRQVMDAVRQRSEAIRKIESQIIELAELFQDMDNLVMQQEAAVVNIEQKGEEVVENLDKGTEQIGVAIKSARNARKWKWWCLGIVGKSPLLHLRTTRTNNSQSSSSQSSSLSSLYTNSSFKTTTQPQSRPTNASFSQTSSPPKSSPQQGIELFPAKHGHPYLERPWFLAWDGLLIPRLLRTLLCER
jgi:syntaxin 1B/2/3